jgi:hypothetical protein
LPAVPATDAREVILHLIRAADGAWSGKTRLFKAFYFAHLYYAAENPGLLTDWPIARLPEGPGIDDSASLFGKLVAQDYITIERTHEGPYPEFRYRLTDKAKLLNPPEKQAKLAIEKAAEFARAKLASELSNLTHEHSRSWKKGANGDILDIYVDLIPDDEFEKEQADTANLDRAMMEALNNSRS